MTQPPINLIFQGPPGTGKTHRINQLKLRYQSNPNLRTPQQWLTSISASCTWWEAIGIAIADLTSGKKDTATVTEIKSHELMATKNAQQEPKSIEKIIWSHAQIHTNLDSTTVNSTRRSAPGVFDKADNDEGARSQWYLIDDWRTTAPTLAEKFDHYMAGPPKFEQRWKMVTFHQSFSYEEFIEGKRMEDGNAVPMDGIFKRLCSQARKDPKHHYALFIDEINRGNITAIFGELLTLIEADKRCVWDAEGQLISGMEITLSQSEDLKLFGVPANLDIYATQNTADRSIAAMDLALRRRFTFEEMKPDPSLLTSVAKHGGQIPINTSSTQDPAFIDLPALLERLNQRITFLDSPDRAIGHAYFWNVTDYESVLDVFYKNLIPLLQEYFFNDGPSLQLVLGPDLIQTKRINPNHIFPKGHGEDPREIHTVIPREKVKPQMIQALYASA